MIGDRVCELARINRITEVPKDDIEFKKYAAFTFNTTVADIDAVLEGEMTLAKDALLMAYRVWLASEKGN